MKETFNEATTSRPLGDRVIDGPLVKADLCRLMKQIGKEKKWKESDRNAITVFKTTGIRIVLIALHKGAEMTKHAVKGMISIQVLKGKLQFDSDGRKEELTDGHILVLHEGISHSIIAKKKTTMLLTITRTLVENIPLN